MKKIALASVGLLILFCVWYFDFPHARDEKIHALHGRSESAVLKRFGTPDDECRFTMDQLSGEFRVELYNTYPPDSPGNANVEIRECTWIYSRYTITVWFHQLESNWVVLDTCRYQNGISF